MSQDSIRDLLLAKGKELFQGPPRPVPFTDNARANAYLNRGQLPTSWSWGFETDAKAFTELHLP
jgi:hypothetical protein